MIKDWKRLVTSGLVPPGVQAFTNHPDHNYYSQPNLIQNVGEYGWWYTGKQECPECFYTTDENDQLGFHSCPELVDNSGNKMSVNDFVYAYCHGKIRRARLLKFKKSTGNYTVEDVVEGKKSAISGRSKILKASEHEQEGFRQAIIGSV